MIQLTLLSLFTLDGNALNVLNAHVDFDPVLCSADLHSSVFYNLGWPPSAQTKAFLMLHSRKGQLAHTAEHCCHFLLLKTDLGTTNLPLSSAGLLITTLRPAKFPHCSFSILSQLLPQDWEVSPHTYPTPHQWSGLYPFRESMRWGKQAISCLSTRLSPPPAVPGGNGTAGAEYSWG